MILFTHGYTRFYALLLGLFFFHFSVQAQHLVCPTDVDVGNDVGECGATVMYPDPDVILPYGDLELVEGLPSGSFFDVGTTTQTFIASDGSGNVLTCSFDVTVNDLSVDSDCDGIGDDCDVCPGADDQVDNNGDGFPDCAVFPGYSNVISDWICKVKKNKRKFLICHLTNGGHNNTLCISENAVSAHLAHGDFLGPCTSCAQNRQANEEIQEPQITAIELFPNPATELINIEMIGLEDGDVQIEILNLNGQLVMEETIRNLDGEITYKLELNDKFTNGLYVVRATQKNLSITKSLVILRP